MKQISFDSSGKKFLLQTSDSSYGLGISPATGFPVHLHFGEKLRTPDELPAPEEVQNLPRIRETRRRHTFLEYPAFHSAHYSESCLLALHPSGARGTRLEFDSFQLRENANSETLELLLADKLHQLFVTLVYTVHADSPLLDRRAVIRNGGVVSGGHSGPAPFALTPEEKGAVVLFPDPVNISTLVRSINEASAAVTVTVPLSFIVCFRARKS